MKTDDAPKDKLDEFELLAHLGDLGKWARGKTLAELDAVEDDAGRTFYPATILRFVLPAKQVIEQPIYLRLPGGLESAQARVEALRYLAKIAGVRHEDFDEETAIKKFGHNTFTHTDNIFILAKCIRKRSDPQAPYMTPEMLDECHSGIALATVLEQVNHLKQITGEVLNEAELSDANTFWTVVAGIVKTGSLSGPLAVTGAGGASAFFTRMAVVLCLARVECPTLESWPR